MSDQDLIKVTITMTKDERRALKQLALDRDTTVSALIRGWLAENSVKEDGDVVK